MWVNCNLTRSFPTTSALADALQLDSVILRQQQSPKSVVITTRCYYTEKLVNCGRLTKWTALLRLEGLLKEKSAQFIVATLRQNGWHEAETQYKAPHVHKLLCEHSLDRNPLWVLITCIAMSRPTTTAISYGSELKIEALNMYLIVKNFIKQKILSAHNRSRQRNEDEMSDADANFYEQLAHFALKNELDNLYDGKGQAITSITLQDAEEEVLQHAVSAGMLHKFIAPTSELQRCQQYAFLHRLIAEYFVGCYIALANDNDLHLIINYHQRWNSHIPYFALMCMLSNEECKSKLDDIMKDAMAGRSESL